MKFTDNVDRIVDKNSAAYLTLSTFREAVQRFFGIDEFPLIQSNDVKREVRKAVGVDNPNHSVAAVYPYSYWSLSDIGLVKDQQPIKGVARNSLGFTVDELQNAIVKKAYLFPSSINVEMHYVTKDLIDALNFSTRALLVGHSGKLNAKVQMDGAEWFVTTVMTSETISLPRSDKDSEADPEAMDLVVSFRIDTKLGVMRDVPKINNRGTVTQSVELKEHRNE
ncbi:hypothetical protein D3C85_501950 [compost metagenome]